MNGWLQRMVEIEVITALKSKASRSVLGRMDHVISEEGPNTAVLNALKKNGRMEDEVRDSSVPVPSYAYLTMPTGRSASMSWSGSPAAASFARGVAA